MSRSWSRGSQTPVPTLHAHRSRLAVKIVISPCHGAKGGRSGVDKSYQASTVGACVGLLSRRSRPACLICRSVSRAGAHGQGDVGGPRRVHPRPEPVPRRGGEGTHAHAHARTQDARMRARMRARAHTHTRTSSHAHEHTQRRSTFGCWAPDTRLRHTHTRTCSRARNRTNARAHAGVPGGFRVP